MDLQAKNDILCSSRLKKAPVIVESRHKFYFPSSILTHFLACTCVIDVVLPSMAKTIVVRAHRMP